MTREQIIARIEQLTYIIAAQNGYTFAQQAEASKERATLAKQISW
jgi:hypothetical protein